MSNIPYFEWSVRNSLIVHPGIRPTFCTPINILPKTQPRSHNTTTPSVLHLISFWVVQTDVFGVVVHCRNYLRDSSKPLSGNWIALNLIFRQRFGESMNIVAPANSIVLLAPVSVQNFILVLKSVERVQIGALLHFESCIYEIVLNFRDDHFAQLQVQSQRTLCSRWRGSN